MVSLFPWIFFAGMTVVSGLMFNVATKIATQGHLDMFMFSLLFCLVGLVGNILIVLVYKYTISPDYLPVYDAKGIWMGILAGVAGIMINLFYFLAMKTGSAISSQAVWTVGGLIAVTIVMTLFFKEVLSPQKAIGIVLGVISLLLIVRS
jgi:uncharacterized membrane protein